jgi:hypothetical protein
MRFKPDLRHAGMGLGYSLALYKDKLNDPAFDWFGGGLASCFWHVS